MKLKEAEVIAERMRQLSTKILADIGNTGSQYFEDSNMEMRVEEVMELCSLALGDTSASDMHVVDDCWVKEPKSSTVEKIKFDPTTAQLEVTFKSGGSYRFEGVPADVAARLINAESAGTFFAAEVKGKYPVEKVGDGGAI